MVLLRLRRPHASLADFLFLPPLIYLLCDSHTILYTEYPFSIQIFPERLNSNLSVSLIKTVISYCYCKSNVQAFCLIEPPIKKVETSLSKTTYPLF